MIEALTVHFFSHGFCAVVGRCIVIMLHCDIYYYLLALINTTSYNYCPYPHNIFKSMRRGAPLNQQGKLPVTSPHPADISTLEEGSYDKTLKANAGSYSNFHKSTSSSFGASSFYAPSSSSNNLNGSVTKAARSMASSSMNRLVFSTLTKLSVQNMKLGLWALIALTALFCLILPLGLKIFLLIYSAIAFGVLGSLYLSKSVLECDDGTEEMRQVSDPIREGAEGFLTVQYSAIAKIALPLSFLLVLSYQFRPETHLQGISQLGNLTLGIVSAAGFLVGAVCSAISGYVSMWVAAQSNIRVASAGRRSYTEALVVCFRGGAFSALLNLTLCVAGVATFYVVLYQMFCMNGLLVATNLPMLMVGVSVVYSCIGCIGCIFMERFVENAMLSNCQIYLYLCTCVHSMVLGRRLWHCSCNLEEVFTPRRPTLERIW